MDMNRNSAWADLGGLAAVLLGATLVAIVCMAVVVAAFPGLGQGPAMFLSYTAQFTLAVGGGILWLRRRGGVRMRFGIGWANAPMILGGLLLAIAAGIVIEPLLNFMPDHYLERLNRMIGHGGWAILTVVVAAPVLEELFFRGLVLEHLSRRWSARAAVLASAAIFGVVHAPILPQMVNAFVVAVVMGYIYMATRSLIPVIIIHAINNGLAYLTLELTGSQMTDTRELIGSDILYWTLYAVSAAVLAASLIFMDCKLCNKTGEIPLNEKTTDE